jgi:hypothetical protein
MAAVAHNPEAPSRDPRIVKGPRVDLVTITPGDASLLLSANEGNRKIRDHRVAQYAAIMRAGGWMLTGDAIVIDRDGNLINGQHRLMAVIESGRPCPFVVLRGADPASYSVMDTGSPRSAVDLFRHNGVPRYASDCSGIARLVHAWRAGKAPGVRINATSPDYPTGGDLYAVYCDYRAEIDWAAMAAGECQRISAKSQLGFAFALIAIEAGLDLAAEFMRLVSPKNRDPQGGDYPPRVLREHLMALRAERKNPHTSEVAYKVVSAYNAWREGRSILRLSYQEGARFPEVRK